MDNIFNNMTLSDRHEFHWSECIDDDYMEADSPLWDDDGYIPDEWFVITNGTKTDNKMPACVLQTSSINGGNMDIRSQMILAGILKDTTNQDAPIYLGSIGDIGTHLSNSFNIADKYSVKDNYEVAVEERFHCLNCLNSSIEDKEDNGTAILSPPDDKHHGAISEGNNLLRIGSSKQQNSMECNCVNSDQDQYQHQIDTLNKSVIEIGAGFRRGFDATNERIARLEASIMALIDLKKGPEPDTENHVMSGLISFAERLPYKITIQYFLNTKSKYKQPPKVKIELREKRLDKSSKGYDAPYLTLHGNLYNDCGLSKLDKLLNYDINSESNIHYGDLRDIVNDARKEFCDNFDYIGGAVYDVKTNEVFHDLYFLLNKSTKTGTLFIYIGHDYVFTEFEFKSSKSSGQAKGSDGIYTLNNDVLTGIFEPE